MRLHKEHGLNPSITVCYLCGKDKDIILIGAGIRKLEKAGITDESGKMPNRVCISENPCDRCKDLMERGIIFISVKDNDQAYRTGGWCAITETAVQKMPITEEMKQSVIKNRVCFIADSAYNAFSLPRNIKINNL